MADYTGNRNRSFSIEKHSEFWLKDGSIIISASSKDRPLGLILFKIHESILSMHSQVFRDMFELADDSENGSSSLSESKQVSPTQEKYDGLPVVEVQDTAEDWVTILQTMYKGFFFDSSKIYDPDLEISLMGPMRMAKKYQMDKIHKRLASLVESQWPKNLIEWDQYQTTISQHPELFLEPAAAISLASEHNIKRVLPVAFYLLSIADPNQEYESELTGEPTATPPSRARWDLLGHRDYRKLIVGKEKITLEVKRIRGITFACPHNEYKYGLRIDHVCLETFRSGSPSAEHRFDALKFLTPLTNEDCSNKTRQLNRKEFWKKLPEFFGIEGIDLWMY